MGGARVRLALSFGISAALVVLLLQALDTAELLAALRTADLRWLPVALVLYFLGLWLRSLRWGLLLPPGALSTGSLFRALAVGFTANNLLPVRMGELVRAYLLARWAAVPYGTTLASVLVERLLDGIVLAGVLLVSLLFLPAPGYLLVLGLVVGAAFVGGSALLALAACNAHVLERLAGLLARVLPRGGHLVERLAAGFLEGLGLVRGWSLLLRLALLSLAAWGAELGLFYVLMRAFPLPASPALAMLVGSVANFATLIPSSPGYVGTFDGALIGVLADTVPSVRRELAAAYALLVHVTLFLPVTLLGAAILWRSHLTLSGVSREAEHRAEAAPPETALQRPG